MKSWFRPIFILLTTLLLASSGHFFGMPVHAAKTPTLYISPSLQPLAPAGGTVTISVNVSNISLGNALLGWNIYVRTNNNVIRPVSFSLGSYIPQPLEQTHCVTDATGNAIGTGCDFNDAVPGTVHSLVYSFDPNGGSGNGTLFTITYQAVAGPYSLVTFLEPGSSTQLFDTSGAAISFTPEFGSYGNVPSLPIAEFTWEPVAPLDGDPVIFNGTSSNDPQGHKIVDYEWTFQQTSIQPFVSLPPTPSDNHRICTPLPDFSPPRASSACTGYGILSVGDWTVTLVVKNDQGVVSAPIVHSLHVGLRLIRDLAIFLNPLSVDPTIVLPGTPLTFVAYVKNVGTTTETNFNVSLSVPGQVFNAPPYGNLLIPMHETLFTFTWNTTLVQPGTYTIHANVAPLVNETDTANNDSILNLTFVPYVIFTTPFNSLEPTRPHQHELTTTVGLQSGVGFAGTIMFSSSSIGPKQVFPTPQNELSIGFKKSTIALASKSFASTTLTIDLGKKTPPGDYIVHVYAASGAFNFSTELLVTVPSNFVRMPRLSWNPDVSLSGVQTWEATVVNTLPTSTYVTLEIFSLTSQGPSSGCFPASSVFVPAKSTVRLTVSCRPFDGFQLGQTFTFTATLTFTGLYGFQFLSSDVRTGTFTIVP